MKIFDRSLMKKKINLKFKTIKFKNIFKFKTKLKML